VVEIDLGGEARVGGEVSEGEVVDAAGLKLPDAPSARQTSGCARFYCSCSSLVTLAWWARGVST